MRSVIRLSGVLVLGLGMTIFAGCGGEPEEEEPVVRPVRMLTVDAENAGGTLEYPGNVRAAQNSELAFEVPGKITEFTFKEGDFVDAGQVLARIDPRDYQARLDSELAVLNQAQASLDRYQELFDKDVVSRAEVDLRERQYGVAEAAVREAEKALEDTELRAIFKGRVARKLVNDFQNVQAKEPILVLQDESSLEIKVAVPESDLRFTGGGPQRTREETTERFKPTVIISAFPTESFPSRVKEFSTTADPVTRTFELTLGFDTPESIRVLPGMTAKAILKIPSDANTGFVLPIAALGANPEDQPVVWVVDAEMRVHSRSVEIGEATGNGIRVKSGVSDGDVIVTSGVSQLQEDMQVSKLEAFGGRVR